jgi:hypothetical protein
MQSEFPGTEKFRFSCLRLKLANGKDQDQGKKQVEFHRIFIQGLFVIVIVCVSFVPKDKKKPVRCAPALILFSGLLT